MRVFSFLPTFETGALCVTIAVLRAEDFCLSFLMSSFRPQTFLRPQNGHCHTKCNSPSSGQKLRNYLLRIFFDASKFFLAYFYRAKSAISVSFEASKMIKNVFFNVFAPNWDCCTLCDIGRFEGGGFSLLTFW